MPLLLVWLVFRGCLSDLLEQLLVRQLALGVHLLQSTSSGRLNWPSQLVKHFATLPGLIGFHT